MRTTLTKSLCVALLLISLSALFLTACSSQERVGADVTDDGSLDAGSARNTLRWGGDGTASTTSAQPFGATVEPTGIDAMSTGPTSVFSIGTPGVLGISPGDVAADSIEVSFSDPLELPDGSRVVLPKTVKLEGFSSAKSPVILATNPQVEIWADALKDLSDDQKEAIIAELEAQGEIASEFAGALRDRLGLLIPTP